MRLAVRAWFVCGSRRTSASVVPLAAATSGGLETVEFIKTLPTLFVSFAQGQESIFVEVGAGGAGIVKFGVAHTFTTGLTRLSFL